MNYIFRYVAIAFFCASLFLIAGGDAENSNWPTWRGPNENGIALATPPIQWGEKENVKWKIEVPGSGHATPVIWQDRIYVLTAVKSEQVEAQKKQSQKDGKKRRRRGVQPDHVLKFTVLALDRNTGETIWERVAIEAAPHEGTHLDATWASNSPITDGEHLFAHFGSRGIFCYTMDGELVWQKDLGDMRTRRGFGEGSSPALHENILVINWDHEEASFIVALDKNTGEELWRDERDEPTSWSTPLIYEIDGKQQVVVSATNKVAGYDLKTGKELWYTSGMTLNVIPTPIVFEDLLFVMSGFRGNALQAIKIKDLAGNIQSGDAIKWEYNKDTPYVPTGVQYNGRLYFTKTNNAILTCLDARTGKPVYDTQRLSGLGTIYSSMIAANGHIYITSKNGTTLVLKDGESFEVASANKLDDFFSASPIAVGNELYLRGSKYLYCISAN